ncbi:SpaA isopeptide-forming pilin-related protein [Enterococcus malodoratus]|uniref:SpaA isopeptide-forming pilin-related protein n=1 Tax=Enterococcus malodoratus TaxID=71451 RepID=UPI003FD5DD8F
MKKIMVLVLGLLFFSIVVELISPIITVRAETTGTKLVDHSFLQLEYSYKKEGDKNQWRIMFKRQAKNEAFRQRLKFKITDEKEQVIDYPEIDHMIEEDDWFLEKNFSVEKDEQLIVESDSSVDKLYLSVQMDQQKLSSDTASAEEEIQKDIMEQEKPFVLESKTSDEKQSEHAASENLKLKEVLPTANSEEFIGPKQSTKNADSSETSSVLRQMYNPLYKNKETQYTTDGTGTYPTMAWQPEGQTNVINHQGGYEKASGWDNVTSWNVANDEHKQSYIKYGEDQSDPNIHLRKYAQQTDKEDEFKIKLNVRGNVTYKPGVDLVFLLDNSGSMSNYLAGATQSRKKDAQESLSKIIGELKKVYANNQDSIRIGSHIFSDYEGATWGTSSGETMTFPLSSNHANWDKMVAEYSRAISVGQTFTQRGIKQASDIFSNASNMGERHKLLFVLTDGAPNKSWSPLTAEYNESMYYDPTLITTFNQGTAPNYLKGSLLGSTGSSTKFDGRVLTVNNQRISSHLTTTNSTAHMVKNEGIEIHSLAMQIATKEGDYWDHPTSELINGMYKMATKKANTTGDSESDYFFYHVQNLNDLTEYFNQWYKTIIRTVDKGEVTDPLGDMVELVPTTGKAPKVKQIDNGAPKIDNDDLPVISIAGDRRQIKVNNINLTEDQEIELEYTVRLKTNDAAFVSNRWYPANKTTTLRPTPERTNDIIEFGIPSVKYKKADFVIPVEKIWSDTYREETDYWGLRADDITVTLQKAEGATWQDIESKVLNPGNNWKDTFSPVEGGEKNTYRVIESKRTRGYKEPSLNQSSFTSETMINGGIKITNELLREDYQFWKFMEDGTTTFANDLPKFQVERSDGKILAQDVTPDDTGKITIKDFPIGDYIVKETYVPVGYQKMDDFEIKVTEGNPPTTLVFKVKDKAEEYHALNQLKDFSLKIEKVDPDEKLLSGAIFKLIGPNNYEKTITSGPIFDFTNLRPGSYTLIEVDNPNGYERIQDPINFEIKVDGTVAILNHPNVSGSGGINGGSNTISLKVTNKKVKEGVLPSTGGVGIHSLFLIAGILVIAGIVVSVVYLYRDKYVS